CRVRRRRHRGLRAQRRDRRRDGLDRFERIGPVSEGSEQSNAARLREVNATIRYTMWSVFRATTPLGTALRDDLASEVGALFDQLSAKDVVVRGTYDVSALRADADLMVWWHSSTVEALQDAYGRLRRTRLGAHLAPVWSNAALH